MRKNTVKIFISALCSALVLSTAAGLFALERDVNATAEAAAQAAQTDVLISPEHYENYLRLSDPSSVAVSENYTAIADGDIIYIYDRDDNQYRKYTHGEKVSKLQFDQAENLYFSDKSTNLHLLSPNSEQAQETDINCSGFVINGDAIYYTVVTEGSEGSTILSARLSDPTQKTEHVVVTGNPAIAYYNNELYFTNSGIYLNKFNPETNPKPDLTKTLLGTIPAVNSMTVCEGLLAYSSSTNEFYAYALPLSAGANVPLLCETGTYKALTSFNGYVYAVDGNIVKQFSPADKAFTDYEICADSSAPNRLRGATDTALAGDKLFIADNGNDRISVFNTANGEFEKSVVSTLFPSFLSSDGETLLAASATTTALYDLSENNYGGLLAVFDEFRGAIKGAASVYGKHYLVTEGFVYTLSQNLESGEWQTLTTQRNSFYPKLFAADVYGNLYVLQNNGVYAFTESELTDAEKAGRLVCPLSLAHAEKLAVDYHRNVYALANGKIYKNGDTQNAVDFNVPLVYADGVSVTAFIFGVEENQTYLLCDGNYLIRSERLELPTVKTIPVNGADEIIFSAASAEFSVVETEENALLVEFELSELGGAETFPYLAYERSQDKKTALKIGEAGEYYLLAVFDQTRYRTYLSRSEFCSPLAVDDYRTEYAESKVGYLTNEVTLYKFPYLTHLLTVQKLQRGEQVRVLGEITRLDHDYYQVEVVDGEGNATGVTGYVPKAYVSETDGLPPTSENVIFGATDDNGDAIWRLAYLLLGFAAICILVDFLILRKKKD